MSQHRLRLTSGLRTANGVIGFWGTAAFMVGIPLWSGVRSALDPAYSQASTWGHFAWSAGSALIVSLFVVDTMRANARRLAGSATLRGSSFPPGASVVKYDWYLRPNLWNVLRCVPVILATDGHSIALTDQYGAFFHEPTTSATARFTTFAMILDVGGREYPLIPMGSKLSPYPTPQMKKEVADSIPISTEWLDTVVPGCAAGPVATWRDVFPHIGVRIVST